MDAKAILLELAYAEGLPRAALKAATAKRDEMLPLFVEEIETYLALEPAVREGRPRCSSFSTFSANGGRRPLTGLWRAY